MRAKSRLLRWLTAIVALTVTASACVAAQARSADDLVRLHGSHFRSDKYRKSSLDTVRWERQRRKVHRRSESSRASPAIGAKSKPGKSARGVSKKLSGVRLSPSKTFRCRDHDRHSGRNRTPLLKRQAPISIPRMSPAHLAIVISDWRKSLISSCCRGSSVRVSAAAAT